ncbi:MAG: hypothetical protein KatS3mg103_0755 [Phycisphaerales bacterium]|nr:MAG: hypothetical protein KatS3mg103_0755 [Phycisphaerales bacterium]
MPAPDPNRERGPDRRPEDTPALHQDAPARPADQGHDAPAAGQLGDDDAVCLCFRVPLGKIRRYLRRENPPVASMLSQCLGAGTGCGWCIPVLEMLHRQHAQGQPLAVRIDPAAYAAGRRHYRSTGTRPSDSPAADAPASDPPAEAHRDPDRPTPPAGGPGDDPGSPGDAT